MDNLELNNVERAALAITGLTYAEMIEVGAGLRDIISDRSSDDAEALTDARSVADILHSWASSQLQSAHD